MKSISRLMAAAFFLAAACITGLPATSSATPAYNPPGMDVGATLPTPTIDGIQVPSLFGTTPNWNLSPPLPKFVDNLPGLCTPTTLNDPNVRCIPVAVPDTTTYPGSDYYEIKIVQYTEKLHSNLGPTTLRGYVQTNGPNGNNQIPRYLGPIIQAQKDRPVRIKFTNALPAGTAGKLFLPVDTTIMGSGKGPLKADGSTCTWELNTNLAEPMYELGNDCASYTQNRADLHLHGGLTPWISDGTPHQWIIPAEEYQNTPYQKGVSAVSVPDMPDPGPGSMTYYYSNQQSARLMFYHDHSYGLTRLNVYAGEAAGYMIRDDVEKSLIEAGIIPGTKADGTVVMGGEIPLVIQDKGFVDPATIGKLDPTWAWGTKPNPLDPANETGDLWWPHVYMPAENPYDLGGINPMGRWVYGLWFWPPTTGIPFQLKDNPYYDPACANGPDSPGCVAALAFEPPQMPSVPNPSWTAEAFMDTMLVNGAAYPKVALDPKAYRLRILNAAHDRFLNLQLYVATTTLKTCTISGGTGYQVGDLFTLTGGLDPTKKYPQAAEASVTEVDVNGAITKIRIDNYGAHYLSVPTGLLADTADPAATGATLSGCSLQEKTEVAMVPAINYREYAKLNKEYLPNDLRDGGVPDPTTAGPSWIQIGTEGGFLPQPVVIPPYPVTWLNDPTMFNAGNVVEGSLRLGPAERADVIVDLSAYGGKTLILYNDAPAAYPAAVPQNDYYTGSPDLADSGGHPGVIPGFSPNTRTIMQINVNAGTSSAFDLATLQAQFQATAPGGSVFQKGQEPIIIGQTAYDSAYFTPTSGTKFPATYPTWGYSEIGDTKLNFMQPDGTLISNFPMEPKAIHDEMGAVWDEYGRMSAKLGLEVPQTNNMNQNFVMQNYVDPPTEIVDDGQIQIWKVTHNGVDTHPIHFHLFDVQVINRVGWDGFKRLPDPNELGWKETVRFSPLEDTIVALKPRSPKLPFGLPDSIRKLQPALPDNTTQGFTNLYTAEKVPGDGLVGEAKMGADIDTNQLYNYGDEYVWHCHILSHEEQDMMRPIKFNVLKTIPDAPTNLVANVVNANQLNLTWNDPTPVNYVTREGFGNPKAEIGFRIERSVNGGTFEALPTILLANTVTFTDTDVVGGTTYAYRVVAYNGAGTSSASNLVTVGTPGVTITAPATGMNYFLPATVTITTETAASITKVEFYDGATLLGTDTTAPFSFTWSPATASVSTITAKGFDAFNQAYVSDPVTVTFAFKAAPPTNMWVRSSTGTGESRVSWGSSATSGVTYVLEESTDPTFATGTIQVYAGTSLAVNLPGHSNGTYYYRVKATKAGYLDSDWVVGPNGCVVALTCQPTGSMSVSTSSSIGEASVSWGASITSDVIYVLQESKDPTFATGIAIVYSGPLTAVTLPGHLNGTYYYRVKVTKAGYIDSRWTVGPNGCVITVTCQPPTNMWVRASSSIGEARVSWSASTIAGATYILQESTDPTFATGAAQVYSGSLTAVNLPGHSNGTYYYRVKAMKTGYLDSDWVMGPNGCVVAIQSAAPPTNVWVRASSTIGETRVSWSASVTTGVTYVLQESTDPTFATGATQVYSGTVTAVNLPGHTNGTYYYRVKAVKAGYLDSDWVVGPNGCIVSLLIASPPTNVWVRASSSTGESRVSWTASATTGVTYVLHETTDPTFTTGWTQVYSGTTTAANLPGHVNGTYYYRVKATKTGYLDSEWVAGPNGCVVTIP